MAFQPWPCGQTQPMLIIPLKIDDAGAEDITGADYSEFSLYLGDSAGTGQLAIMDQSPAKLIYKLSASDVARPKVTSIQIRRTLPSPSGGDPVIYDSINFYIG